MLNLRKLNEFPILCDEKPAVGHPEFERDAPAIVLVVYGLD